MTDEQREPEWSRDLPEPTRCVLDPDDGCVNAPQDRCTCKWDCGESSEAGCCFCVHRDPYLPCPRGGYWCYPDCGDPSECCEPEQRTFAQMAYFAAELDRWEARTP